MTLLGSPNDFHPLLQLKGHGRIVFCWRLYMILSCFFNVSSICPGSYAATVNAVGRLAYRWSFFLCHDCSVWTVGSHLRIWLILHFCSSIWWIGVHFYGAELFPWYVYVSHFSPCYFCYIFSNWQLGDPFRLFQRFSAWLWVSCDGYVLPDHIIFWF